MIDLGNCQKTHFWEKTGQYPYWITIPMNPDQSSSLFYNNHTNQSLNTLSNMRIQLTDIAVDLLCFIP